MHCLNTVSTPRRAVRFSAFTILVSSLIGCASVAVSDEAIVDRTAFALGLEKGSFTVDNRVDDGVTSTYRVKTKRGEEFNCYVGGSLSVVGRVVSDAICNKKGEVAKNPLLR